MDSTINTNLIQHLPNRCSNVRDADICVVPISFYSDYKYDPTLENIKTPVVILDFMEFGSQWIPTDSHVWGRNSNQFPITATPDGMRLDAWIRDGNTKVQFVRELLQKDVTDRIKPIEFPCYINPQPIQTKAEFDARPITALASWGFSHVCRPKFHSDVFKGMAEDGIGVIAAWDQFDGYFNEKRGETWASIFCPHYTRIHIDTVVQRQAMSKISVSMFGNGKKCFRSAEAMVNAVLFVQENDLAWSVPLVHGENCIKGPVGGEYQAIRENRHRPDLYEIYVNAVNDVDRLRGPRYVRDYILPNIEACL